MSTRSAECLLNAGAPIDISIDGFLNSTSMELSNIQRGYVKHFDFCIAFFKIEGFLGTRGTRSKGAPDKKSFRKLLLYAKGKELQ